MIATLLNKSKEASASAPVDVKVRKPDDESDYDAMDSAAEDLISAIHSKNVKGVKEAIKAAFELCELYPHEEGPHIEGNE